MLEDSQPEERTRSSRRSLKVFYTAAAIGLAAVLLYFSLRGIDWRRVGQILRSAHPSYIMFCCLLSSVTLFLRAYRWRILLRAEGEVSVSTAFWATAAGYFGNNFLPARAGEVVRTFMISARSNLSKTFVLTTALSERVADAIALVTISALVLLTLPFRPGWLEAAAKPFAAAGVAAVVALAVLPYLENVSNSLLRAVPLPSALHDRLTHLLMHIMRGIRSFHDPRRLGGFLGLTVVIWCLDATNAVLCARAIGVFISIPTAFLLIAGLGLGSALPSTPGYVGIYQFVAVNVLAPFGISRTDAIAYILLLQALAYIIVGFWGALAFMQRRKTKAAGLMVEIAPRL